MCEPEDLRSLNLNVHCKLTWPLVYTAACVRLVNVNSAYEESRFTASEAEGRPNSSEFAK